MRRIVLFLCLIAAGTPLWPMSRSMALHHRSMARTALAESPLALTVPADTLVKARLLTGMHTLISRVDDPVSAQMTQPVYIGGRLALPAGTLFDGRITAVHPPGRMGRRGEIAFRFDRVTLPTGQEFPVTAVIASLDHAPGLKGKLDSEGHMEGRRKSSWKTLFGGFLTVGGLTAARVAIASTALSAAAPASAAAFLGYEIFLRRAGNISVPPQTGCKIRLTRSLILSSLT